MCVRVSPHVHFITARVRTYSIDGVGGLILFAVFESGGKQHRVSEGDIVRLEKIEAEQDAEVEFDRVLMISTGDGIEIGNPLVKGAKVSGRVVSQERDPKVRVLKFKRRKNYLRNLGHKQLATVIQISSITTQG